MFGIGGTELVIILIFGFLIFGPDRLPAMGRTIGRALRQFQQAQDQMNKMVKTEIYDPINEAAKADEKKQGPKKKTTAAAATKPETFAEKKARLAAEAQAKTAGGAVSAEGDTAAAEQIVVPEKPVGRSETFAEKKARLEAERAAAAAKGSTPAPAKTDGAKVRTASSSAKKKTSGTTHSAKLYGLGETTTNADASAAASSNGKGDQADAE